MERKKIILFDGVCNLCNSFVQFVIKYDKKEQFMFAALQSDFGKKELLKRSLYLQNIDSVVLLDNEKTYVKSAAAIKIAYYLGGVFKLAIVLNILPKFLKDKGYDFVAKNRYKWFGKQSVCVMPTPELTKRFLN